MATVFDSDQLAELMKLQRQQELQQFQGQHPFIWQGAPPVPPEPIPDMTGGYVPPTPQARAQAAMMGPMQGIQVPPSLVQDRTGETPPIIPKQQPTGWRNTVKQIARGVGEAMEAAGTPNIAGGGGFDVVRSLGVGSQVRKQREAYEKQQEVAAEQRKIEAERRKIEAEDRQRRIEYETRKEKREEADAQARMESHKAQKEHYEALKAKKPGTLTEVGGKLYDNEKGEWILPPTDVEQRDTYYTKLYEAKKARGDKDAESFNPSSKRIRELIDYGRYGDPDDKINRHTGGKYGIISRGDPAALKRLMAFEDSEHASKLALADKRRAQKMASGELTPAQKLRWAEGLRVETYRKRVGLDKEKQQFDRNMTAFKKRHDNTVPAEGTTEREEYDKEEAQILADYAQGRSIVQEAYTEGVGTYDAMMGVGGDQPTGSPAAGAPASGASGDKVRIFTGPDGKKYRYTGRDAQGNVTGDPI